VHITGISYALHPTKPETPEGIRLNCSTSRLVSVMGFVKTYCSIPHFVFYWLDMKNCLDLYEIKSVGMLAATAKDMVFSLFFWLFFP
jgi:hypothetical protein